MDRITFEFSEKVKALLKDNLRSIILFGSRARDDSNVNSDYVFIIVVNKKNNDIREKILDIEVNMMDKYNELVASLIYDEESWEKESRFPLGINIRNDGIIL